VVVVVVVVVVVLVVVVGRVDVVVVGREVVVVGRVVDEVGRDVPVVGPAPDGAVVVVVVGRWPGLAPAATVTHQMTEGSMVVVVVAPTDGGDVSGSGRRLGVARSTWIPLTWVVVSVRASRHLEMPNAASTTSTATSRPLRMRSSGV
jgi:hypothetical protein